MRRAIIVLASAAVFGLAGCGGARKNEAAEGEPAANLETENFSNTVTAEDLANEANAALPANGDKGR